MERKLYPCKECGSKVPIRSKGLCGFCASLNKTPKKPKPIKKITAKKAKEKKEKQEKLNPFFEYHISQIKKNPVCQNCGARLKATRDEVCHLLPKRKQGGNPEVMSNLDNALYMCCMFSENNCHDKFDKLQYTEEVYDMPVWQLAVEKFKLLEPHIKNNNKIVRNFKNYLGNNH